MKKLEKEGFDLKSKNKKQEEFSIYYHDTLNSSTYNSVKKFVDKYLQAQAEIYDMMGAVNSFINFKNKSKTNYFEAEGRVLGLGHLITMAGVEEPQHREIFEDIAYRIFQESGSTKERALKIHNEWRKAALKLRDQDLH